KNQLHATWVGSEFIYMESVDSTNIALKRIPPSELIHGTVLLTDHQTKGRGQYEKKWEAEPAKNLTFTIAFRPPAGERLTLLTLASAHAIRSVLEEKTGKKTEIKWPNDLLIEGKKVGGILTEGIFNGQKLDRVLIGVGLNVLQTQFSKEIEGLATSMKKITGQNYSREKLLSELLQSIEVAYQKWHKQDAGLCREISEHMIGYGEWVQLTIGNKHENGKYKFLGVNEKGELLALNEDLDIKTFTYEQIRIIVGS
ncbi:MAG: biotin--[acetyl-CoA-carboxylase] ligase, partial [Balneolaceae bacterium]